MKKFIMLQSFIMLSFLFGLNTEAVSENCYEKITLQTINSNNLLTYIQNNNFQVSAICTTDFCDTLKSFDPKKSVEKFIDDYHTHLKKIVNEETYLSVYLKGFKIDSIEINKCFSSSSFQ